MDPELGAKVKTSDEFLVGMVGFGVLFQPQGSWDPLEEQQEILIPSSPSLGDSGSPPNPLGSAPSLLDLIRAHRERTLGKDGK